MYRQYKTSDELPKWVDNEIINRYMHTHGIKDIIGVVAAIVLLLLLPLMGGHFMNNWRTDENKGYIWCIPMLVYILDNALLIMSLKNLIIVLTHSYKWREAYVMHKEIVCKPDETLFNIYINNENKAYEPINKEDFYKLRLGEACIAIEFNRDDRLILSLNRSNTNDG